MELPIVDLMYHKTISLKISNARSVSQKMSLARLSPLFSSFSLGEKADPSAC